MSDTLKSVIINPSVVTFCLLLELNLLPSFVHVTYGTDIRKHYMGSRYHFPSIRLYVWWFHLKWMQDLKIKIVLHDEINHIKIVFIQVINVCYY